MVYSLTWLPTVLKTAGLKVVEQPGWQTRGHGDVGKMLGVLCHHTAGPDKTHGNFPDLDLVVRGRPGLEGPLCNLGLARDGTYHIVAAGKAWHAGEGNWPGVGLNGGNAHLIGIEATNTGLANDNPWPLAQVDAYVKGCAALLKHIGAPAAMCLGHLEYAPNRKSDPSFSVGNRDQRLAEMKVFRARVATAMAELKGNPVQPAPPAALKYVTVNTAGLNLRTLANGTSAVITQLPKGTKLTVLGEDTNGDTKWLNVITPPPAGQEGWVAGKYVT